eukprot:g695.t1
MAYGHPPPLHGPPFPYMELPPAPIHPGMRLNPHIPCQQPLPSWLNGRQRNFHFPSGILSPYTKLIAEARACYFDLVAREKEWLEQNEKFSSEVLKRNQVLEAKLAHVTKELRSFQEGSKSGGSNGDSVSSQKTTTIPNERQQKVMGNSPRNFAMASQGQKNLGTHPFLTSTSTNPLHNPTIPMHNPNISFPPNESSNTNGNDHNNITGLKRKRSRGRPKGSKNRKGTLLDLKKDEQISLDRPAMEKRGRGRPKGSKNKRTKESASIAFAVTTDTEKRGRGRPKGRKNNKTILREMTVEKQQNLRILPSLYSTQSLFSSATMTAADFIGMKSVDNISKVTPNAFHANSISVLGRPDIAQHPAPSPPTNFSHPNALIDLPPKKHDLSPTLSVRTNKTFLFDHSSDLLEPVLPPNASSQHEETNTKEMRSGRETTVLELLENTEAPSTSVNPDKGALNSSLTVKHLVEAADSTDDELSKFSNRIKESGEKDTES